MPRVEQATATGRAMSDDVVSAPGARAVAKALERLLFDPTAITPTGAGATLTEAITQLAQAADRLATAINRFTDQQT